MRGKTKAFYIFKERWKKLLIFVIAPLKEEKERQKEAFQLLVSKEVSDNRYAEKKGYGSAAPIGSQHGSAAPMEIIIVALPSNWL